MSKPPKRQRKYTLANEVLAGRAMQGDRDAQKVLDDRRAVQRLCTGTMKGLSSVGYCCHLSEEVRLHFRKSRERPGHVRIFLEIGERTSLEAVKQQWEGIRTWRNLLLGWQGPSPSGINGFVYRLHLDHRQGQSYAAIAERLNESMCSILEMYQKGNYELRQEIKKGTIQTSQDLMQWQRTTQSDTSELDLVQHTLQKYGFADDEINDWCLCTLENSVSGCYPFHHIVLFTRDWMVSKLRSWRTRNQLWLATADKALYRTLSRGMVKIG